MATKIKKEVKATVSADPELRSKYTMTVPAMGIIVIATMGTYMSSPAISSNGNAMAALLFVLALGGAFSICTYMWRMKADAKGITVFSIFKGERTVYYDSIKRIEIHKISTTFTSYALILKNDKAFVKINPLMTNSIPLLERLQKLGIKVVEK